MRRIHLYFGLILIFLFLLQETTTAQIGTKITQTTLVKTKVNSVLHISCYGDKKGAINIMVSGGVPPYTYQWSNGATTQDIARLLAGDYTVIVRDAYDCPDTLTIEVKQPPKLSVLVDSVRDVLCYGFSNGRVDVSIEGGVPPYVYSWSNESSSQDLQNVGSGEYALLVTDANHCQEIVSALIKQNPLIVRSDEKVQNVDCSGDSTGTIDINVKGGVPPYTYRWTSGQKTEDLNKLVAGTYTVMVSDSRGCSEAYSTKVSEPKPIIVKLDDVRHIRCAGDSSGAISISVKGGVKPYKYRWNDSLAFTQDLAGLGSGEYTLIVKDKHNCSKVLTQEINEPEKLIVDIDKVKNVLNYGGSDGAIYIDVKGGVEPYKYRWSNGSKNQDIANIPANNYTCRIKDDNKCVNTISVNITQPALLEVDIDYLEHIKCYGEKKGYININVKGGVPPYKYTWSNGDTIKDIKNLGSGAYSLLVTDANGMVKTVNGIIEQPDLLSANVQSISNILCYGDYDGIVDINVKGGIPPYTYNWSNGAKTQDITKIPAGNYSVQIVDGNQCIDSLNAIVEQSPLLDVQPQEVVDIKCFGKAEGTISVTVSGGIAPYVFNWSNGAKTRNLSGLKAGQYNLKVTDSKGCNQAIDVRINEPPLLVTSLDNVVDVKCKGDSTGSISINVKGGSVPYVYQWSDGKNIKNNTQIKAGSYSVKIIDAMGCVNTISSTVKEPSKLYSTLDKIVNVDCYGDPTGAIDVSVGGGVSPYTYKWSNNSTTQNLLGVEAGDYVLNVRDQNGCISELNTTIKQNDKLNSTIQDITHVACNGFKTGAAKISVAGGVEPYTFKWSDGSAQKNLSNVKADDYVLTVADTKGCLQKLNILIKEPPAFEGEVISLKQIGCHGDSNGVVLTSFKGGVAPYEYKWNNQETSKDIKNLSAGSYSLTATDKNGCIEELTAVINQPSKLELNLVSSKNNLCFGERNGSIDISVKGGVAPYAYKWTNGAVIQDLANLEAGRYIVYVTGATGCEKSLEATINEPKPLELLVTSITDVNCNGGNNGAVDISVTGGKEPYIYSWSNGATTQDIKNIVAGSYTVNVMDANECINSISAIIKQPETLVANIADVKNINCFGDSTGAISIDVTGGTKPYAYKWSNGAILEDIDGLKIGEYSVEIKDAKGCLQNLKATITQPDILICKVISTQDVLCNDLKEGSIDISVKGGVAPYVYIWSNGSKEQDISNIGAGKYDVKIQDANGCTRRLDAKINEPTMLVVSIAEINDIKEFGSKNGSMSITVDGGSSPYTYSWSNGATTQNISDLVAGNYSVIVSDSNGCRQDLNASIVQPDAVEISVDTIHHIRCYGEKTGYAGISVKGGVPPYKFSWDNGLVGNELKNVPSGKYILTITDANGASKEQRITIDQPEYFKLKIDMIKHPTCYELNNGMIKTDVQGGTTPYRFIWNNGAVTQDLKGLTSGKYTINVTDAKGCSQTDSAQLFKPEALEVTLVSTKHIKCNGEHKGKVNIAVEGGVPPYQYNWNHGSKEQNLSNVIAGNYSVKVMDANKCITSVSTTINEPPSLVARLATVKDVPCYGEKKGFISTSVTGGLPPYTYKWNNGDSTSSIKDLVVGKYNVAITDSNGCFSSLSAEITEPTELTGFVNNVNDISCYGDKEGAIGLNVKGGTPPYKYGWNNGSKEQNLTGIAAGKYNVKVNDDHGCEIFMEAEVKEPSELLAEVTNMQNIKCFGDKAGSINVSVSGGVEPYLYTWSNGATTQDLLNIPAGNYSLRVKDSKSCESTINASVEEPQPLVVENTSINNIKCNGDQEGAVTVSVKGGKIPYTYSWNNGATTRDIQNISAGTYKLKVTDANGCKELFSTSVIEPPFLTKSIDAVKHISCNGESNGSVDLSVSGGIVPYSYQWSNGITSQDLINVPAGDYSVLISEGNGCKSSLDVTINEPTPFLSELLSVEHNNCYGDENGNITISAEGGTTPYSFKWNNNSKTQNLTNIISGDYTVLVADANGCNHTIKTTVEQPPKLILTIDSARNVKCCGDTSGAIFITVKGGITPYKYIWSHGATTQDITGLVEGQYTVSITDANLCMVNTPEEGATIYEKIISQGKFVSRDILFDIGKATIKERSFIEISRIASFMKEHPQIRFSIEGHTDSQGDATANMSLSERRAQAIKESLIKFGISSSRLKIKGMGESKPIDTNSTSEGRANNRRVEFIPL